MGAIPIQQAFDRTVGTSLTTAISPSQAGSLLIACAFCNGGTSPTSFTDSAAESFTEVPGSPGFVIVAVMFNNVGGVTSVTFNATGSSSVILGVAEYSGVIALDTVNQADSGQVPTSATYTSGSLATSGSEDLLVGFINNYTTEAVTLIPDSPFSVRAERSDAGFGWRASILDSLSSPAGTYANSGSFSSGSNTYDAVFIPFLTTPSVITGFASEEANYGIIITG